MIRKGDVLYIHSLDRFGRNKEEILQEWNDITKNIQADIVVMDMPLLDEYEQSHHPNKYKCFFGILLTYVFHVLLAVLHTHQAKTKH
jgi:hypothetical protein